MDDRLREIFDELQPDVIVQDNVRRLPGDPSLRTAVGASRLLQPARGEGCRRSRPCSPAIRPQTAAGWEDFRAEYRARDRRASTASSPRSTKSAGAATAARTASSSTQSEWLNLYLYPAEVDYERVRTRSRLTWHRLDTCVRQTADEAEHPDTAGDGSLVYLSLGSLGSADVELMKRLVDVLSKSPHRFIVSKGPQHYEYELADNMWGEELLPQPAILPLVDAVITHAGNNTTTECMHFGKPMVALPLFWDQYDNAQRVDETGYGIRPAMYEFEEDELRSARSTGCSPTRG